MFPAGEGLSSVLTPVAWSTTFPGAQERAASIRRRLQSTQQRGRVGRQAGATVNCMWSCLIKINTRACLGQERGVGVGLRQQGRLLAPGELRFAVAADGGRGGKEKEKVLQVN